MSRSTPIHEQSFSHLCQLFEQLERIQGSLKTARCEQAVWQWFNQFNSGDIYIVFRLLVPEEDRWRVYELKEERLASLLASLTIGSREQRSIVEWRTAASVVQGDLSLVAAAVLGLRQHTKGSTLTIAEVDRCLNELGALSKHTPLSSSTNMLGHVSTPQAVIHRLFNQARGVEIKWLVRIVLKDMGFNIPARNLMNGFHKDMYRLYLRCANLERACKLVTQHVVSSSLSLDPDSHLPVNALNRTPPVSPRPLDGVYSKSPAFITPATTMTTGKSPMSLSDTGTTPTPTISPYSTGKSPVPARAHPSASASVSPYNSGRESPFVSVYSSGRDSRSSMDSAGSAGTTKGDAKAGELVKKKQYVMGGKMFEPECGTFVKPMLCGRVACLAEANDKLGAGVCLVETKYDGERIQIHYDPASPWKCRIFSRHLRDSTYERSAVIPYLEKAFGTSCGACIFDGEILTFDVETQRLECFGLVQLMAPHMPMAQSSKRHLIVILFDVLMYAGESVMRCSLRERRYMLTRCVTPIREWVLVADAAELELPRDSKTLRDIYCASLSNRTEGIIVKQASARYVPNYRGHWWKLKRDYIPGLGDTVDVCIVGASYSPERKSGGFLDTYALGVLLNPVEVSNSDTVRPQFEVICQVTNGLTAAEMQRMTKALVPMCQSYQRDLPTNNWLSIPTGSADLIKIDMILKDPRACPVAEILCSGFVWDSQRLSLVMRHPRIVKIRTDLRYKQCLTLAAYKNLSQRVTSAPSRLELATEIRLLDEADAKYHGSRSTSVLESADAMNANAVRNGKRFAARRESKVDEVALFNVLSRTLVPGEPGGVQDSEDPSNFIILPKTRNYRRPTHKVPTLPLRQPSPSTSVYSSPVPRPPSVVPVDTTETTTSMMAPASQRKIGYSTPATSVLLRSTSAPLVEPKSSVPLSRSLSSPTNGQQGYQLLAGRSASLSPAAVPYPYAPPGFATPTNDPSVLRSSHRAHMSFSPLPMTDAPTPLPPAPSSYSPSNGVTTTTTTTNVMMGVLTSPMRKPKAVRSSPSSSSTPPDVYSSPLRTNLQLLAVAQGSAFVASPSRLAKTTPIPSSPAPTPIPRPVSAVSTSSSPAPRNYFQPKSAMKKPAPAKHAATVVSRPTSAAPSLRFDLALQAFAFASFAYTSQLLISVVIVCSLWSCAWDLAHNTASFDQTTSTDVVTSRKRKAEDSEQTQVHHSIPGDDSIEHTPPKVLHLVLESDVSQSASVPSPAMVPVNMNTTMDSQGSRNESLRLYLSSMESENTPPGGDLADPPCSPAKTASLPLSESRSFESSASTQEFTLPATRSRERKKNVVRNIAGLNLEDALSLVTQDSIPFYRWIVVLIGEFPDRVKLKAAIRQLGGTVDAVFSERTTHVIIYGDNLQVKVTLLDVLRRYEALAARRTKPLYVYEQDLFMKVEGLGLPCEKLRSQSLVWSSNMT